MGKTPMNAMTSKDLKESTVGKKRQANPDKKQPEGYKGKPQSDKTGENKVAGHSSEWF